MRTRYVLAACSGLVAGALLVAMGGTLIGLAMLALTENRKLFLITGYPQTVSPPRLDWGLMSAGAGVFGAGLAMMVLVQRSVFTRTLVRNKEVMLRLRFVERRGGVRKKRITYPGAQPTTPTSS